MILPVALLFVLLVGRAAAVDFSAPIERLATGFQNSEGPVWVAARGELLFSDVNGNAIHRWRGGQLSTFRMPSNNSNGLALDSQGRLVSCERGTRRVARTEADGTVTVLADRFEGRRFNAPNDLAVRRDGSVYFTDPTFGAVAGSLELDFQGVYRISPDGRALTLVIRDLALPNGLAFSPDERQLYVNDNQTGVIRVYDVAADGSLANGRLFTDQVPGADGMKVDVEGNVYCTSTPGVRVFDRAGRLLGTIVPPERPANCAFGDTDGKSLFMTCRTGLYRVRLDTAGPTGLPPLGNGAADVPPAGGRLVNLAVRSTAGGEPLIMGFAVGPGAAPALLVRGVGPTLAGFGVTGALADPVLTLFGSNSAVLAGNDDWGNSGNAAQITAAAAQSGAFALPGASRDAALLASLGGAAYTVQLTGKGAATGTALIEAYDVSAGGPAAPLVNLSARAAVGTGADVLIAGFVVGGTGSQRLLVRAAGPALTSFGVAGALVDPVLTVFRGTTELAANDNWWTAANAGQVMASAAATGAFPLGFESRDAALLVTLVPGAYSAVVSGVGGTRGAALVELYAVPPPAAVLAEGAWSVRADLIEPNSEMSVAELDGKIYVIGGYPSNRVSVRTVQVYDVATDTWRLTSPLPAALNHTVSAAVGGRLYVIGGQTSAGGTGPFVDTVYAYDPATAAWTTRAPMPTARGGGAGAVIGGRIYVAGGRPPRGSDFAVYDPGLDSWRTLPDLPTQRNHVGAAAIDGKLYVVGGRLEAGFQSEQTDRVEMFDPATNAWATRAPMPKPRGGVNAVAAHGYLHVFGGEGNPAAPSGVYPDHDVYDPVANRWLRLGPMPVPVHGVTGASFVNGNIHLTGGGIADGGENGSTLHQVFRPGASYRP
ncbi:MAG: SMP-30/gluconolactonase/LRE family protein [Opitutaceae bacterium]|nr:SMP-30/gluconolactonase/LRE family protein [Opitutaceae bacterium]